MLAQAKPAAEQAALECEALGWGQFSNPCWPKRRSKPCGPLQERYGAIRAIPSALEAVLRDGRERACGGGLGRRLERVRKALGFLAAR